MGDDAQDVKPFGVLGIGKSTVAYEDGAGQVCREIILVRIGFVLGQRFDLALHILFCYGYEEMREEAVAAADHVKAKDGDAAKRAQDFFGDSVMVLMDVVSGMSEDDIRLKLLITA